MAGHVQMGQRAGVHRVQPVVCVHKFWACSWPSQNVGVTPGTPIHDLRVAFVYVPSEFFALIQKIDRFEFVERLNYGRELLSPPSFFWRDRGDVGKKA